MRDRFFRQNPGPSKPWYERDGGARLTSDRRLVAESYPKLTFVVNEAEERVSLEGEILLVSECGVRHEISTRVTFPRLYPLYEPTAYDAGDRFLALDRKPRMDRHILDNPNGQCCLWLPPRSPWNPRDPNALRHFLDELAVFFDRQLIYDVTGEWPGPQYGHGRKGYIEFIGEELGEARDVVERILPLVTMEVDFGRNDQCPCGSGKKFKRCHLDAIERVKARIGIADLKRIFSKTRAGCE